MLGRSMTLASSQRPALPQDGDFDGPMTGRWPLRRGLFAIAVAGLIGWIALVQLGMIVASVLR